MMRINDNHSMLGRGAVLALLAVLFSTVAVAQEAWQNPAGDIYGATRRDGSTIFAVGEFGKIMASTDGGGSWSFRPSPTRANLSAVTFGDPRTGIIVGNSGTILRTTNGGGAWEMVQDTGRTGLTSVWALSASEYFAIGAGGKVLRTTDAGARWSVVPTPTTLALFRIVFKSDRSAIIVGESGTVLLSQDGGASWTDVPPPEVVTLYACAFRDSLRGLTGGSAGVLDVTTDGGRTWSPASVPAGIDQIRDVRYLSHDTVLAAGLSRSSSKLIRSIDGGKTWGAVEPAGLEAYGGVRAIVTESRGAVLALGLDNLILRSRDLGTAWETVSSFPSSTIGANSQMRIVQVGSADSLHVFATGTSQAGGGGWVYSSADGGAAWVGYRVDESHGMAGLIVVSRDTVVATSAEGSYIYTSTDGGRVWSKGNLITRPFQASFRPEEIVMVADSIGYTLALDSLVWRTTDRGASWDGYELAPDAWYVNPVAISFPTPAVGFAVALGLDGTPPTSFKEYGAVYKSVDSGKTWARLGDKTSLLTGVYFRSTSLGLVCGDSGRIFRTIDGGEHWEQIRLGESLGFNDVRLLNDTLGYAVGGSPKGQVLFETRDGGRSWSPVDVEVPLTNKRRALLKVFSDDGVRAYIPGLNQILLKWFSLSDVVSAVPERPTGAGSYSAIEALPVAGCTELAVRWLNISSNGGDMVIYDAGGNTVLASRLNPAVRRQTFDIRALPAGAYFVVAVGDGGEHSSARFTIVR